jgi:hypothetical protein
MNTKNLLVFAIITLFAVSSISFVSADIPVASSSNAPLTVNPTITPPNALSTGSYIRINGVISSWGTVPVKGVLQTQARIGTFDNGDTKQAAVATAIWTTNLVRPIAVAVAKQDFNYVFYEARLTRASVSSLSASTSSADYALSGTWDVWTVTLHITFTKNDAGQVTGVHRTMDKTVQQASGELKVTNNWTIFTLSIDGKDLTGTVARSVLRQVAFNPFKVTNDVTTNLVTKADIAAVIKSYGAMPGFGNYDPQMDFAGHYKIDITALSTVASNI